MRTSTNTLMGLPIAAVALIGFGGCTTSQPTSSVATKIVFLQDWTQRMDYMGYVPVLPAIEDLRVGDMYVYSVNPLDARSDKERQVAARQIAATTRWGSLPVLGDLADEYQQRPAWPKTPDVYLASGAAAGTEDWREAESLDGRSIFNPQETTTRLPAVGLENFMTVSFSGANLESIIPSEVATLITGSATPETLAVTIRAGSGESYALSMARVISALTEPAAPPPVAAPAVADATGEVDGAPPAAPPPPPTYRVKQPYRDHLDFVGGPGRDRVWLHVVTEVIYIRSADIAIRVKAETPKDDEVAPHELAQGPPPAVQAGAEPKADETEPAEGEQPAAEKPAAPSSGPQTGLTAYAATQLDPVYGAFVRADAINQRIEEMDVDNLPSGTVRFLAVTDESMALRRVWPRGLAIGVKGLFLEVDVETGNILSGGAMRWPVSLAMY
jgi:hypothetical protein